MGELGLAKNAARIVLLSMLVPVGAHPQTFNVKGHVSTSIGPVSGALVTVVDEADATRKFSALADTSGKYQLDIITSVKPHDNLPSTFELEENYPNPFSASTSITYSLTQETKVDVKIYDILGREVKRFKVGSQKVGVHGVMWDGTNNYGIRVIPGVYFSMLQTQEKKAARKMVVLPSGKGSMGLHGSNIVSLPMGISLGKSSSSTQAKTYRVEIACVDSTKPRIVAMESTGVVIGGDTTIDFIVKRAPVARIHGNQSVRVGQYTILDGSGSIQGDGATMNYTWTADPSNPAQVQFLGWYPSIMVGFVTEGTYRFQLVVNNGIGDSQPVIVTVSVNSRNQNIFADPVMELQVRYALRDPSGELTSLELATLDSLVSDVGFGKVTSLAGITNCANLEWLVFGINRITDVTPLRTMTQLKELDLDQNFNINDVSALAGLTNLTKLNLMSNSISDISPLRNMTKMINLTLMDNPITDISSLNNLTELEQLWIGQEVAKTFPLAGTSVISKFTKLWILWITDCDCRDLSFVSALDSLQLLRLSFCNVKDISPVTNLTQLKRLYLDSDSVTDITPLSKLANLNILDLRFNQITNIEPLVNNGGLGQGDAVSLTGNPLDSISVNQYIPALRNRGVTVYF